MRIHCDLLLSRETPHFLGLTSDWLACVGGAADEGRATRVGDSICCGCFRDKGEWIRILRGMAPKLREWDDRLSLLLSLLDDPIVAGSHKNMENWNIYFIPANPCGVIWPTSPVLSRFWFVSIYKWHCHHIVVFALRNFRAPQILCSWITCGGEGERHQRQFEMGLYCYICTYVFTHHPFNCCCRVLEEEGSWRLTELLLPPLQILRIKVNKLQLFLLQEELPHRSTRS